VSRPLHPRFYKKIANISLIQVEKNIRYFLDLVEHTEAVRVVQMQGMGY
jgi:hypothetical protein